MYVDIFDAETQNPLAQMQTGTFDEELEKDNRRRAGLGGQKKSTGTAAAKPAKDSPLSPASVFSDFSLCIF